MAKEGDKPAVPVVFALMSKRVSVSVGSFPPPFF
jgi:hypothetical protein